MSNTDKNMVIPEDLSNNFIGRNNKYHVKIGRGLREKSDGTIECVPATCYEVTNLDTLEGVPTEDGIYCIYGYVNDTQYIPGVPVNIGGSTPEQPRSSTIDEVKFKPFDFSGTVVRVSNQTATQTNVYLHAGRFVYHSMHDYDSLNTNWTAWRLLDNVPQGIPSNPTSTTYTASKGVKLDGSDFKLDRVDHKLNPLQLTAGGKATVVGHVPTMNVISSLVVTSSAALKANKNYAGKIFGVLKVFYDNGTTYTVDDAGSPTVQLADAATNLQVTITLTEGAEYVTNVKLARIGVNKTSDDLNDNKINDEFIAPFDNVYVENFRYQGNTITFGISKVDPRELMMIGIVFEISGANIPSGQRKRVAGELNYTVDFPSTAPLNNKRKSNLSFTLTKP